MLYISFILYFLINIISTFAFIPTGREFHSSILIDKKLYFSGGVLSAIDVTNELFYLDFSKSFKITNNASIPWVDLTYTNGPLKHSATACIGGNNNDTIFIFGGFPYDDYFVNQFNTSKQQWTNITTNGSVPIYREDISCAKFNNGLIAIFSGYINLTYAQNDLWIFNSLTLSWSLSNATNAPSSRFGYSAITLPDDNILYIGGSNPTNNSLYMPMNNLPLYNTKSDTWTSMNISGPTPPARVYFSAILTPDRRIIIFGGRNETVLGDLWILDLATSQCLSSRIFMLNVNAFTWVDEFTLTDTTPKVSNSQFSGLMMGAIVSGVISVIIFIGTIIFIYKNYEKFNLYNYLPMTTTKPDDSDL
ncbi:8333_t:CDS:2 [Gigaspora margarita]|uniref:8333_t:CDS:1 n=1 Tax=Gigaspora margarita TaxID=4874 RepID=A0ABM8W0F8_GIGMA|nr:8333_t:CDS:2 [Gigaspora margarita]